MEPPCMTTHHWLYCPFCLTKTSTITCVSRYSDGTIPGALDYQAVCRTCRARGPALENKELAQQAWDDTSLAVIKAHDGVTGYGATIKATDRTLPPDSPLDGLVRDLQHWEEVCRED